MYGPLVSATGSVLASGLGGQPPSLEAVALSPTLGWLLLGCATCVCLMFAVQSDRWRRFWLTMEDPRPIALFRVVFAFLCICSITNFLGYFEILFSDEGMYLPEAARELAAARQFSGFGDGVGDDPRGFFDGAGVLEFLKGPEYSTLYFWDSPRALWLHLALFYGVTTAFMVGFHTRVAGVLSYLLLFGLLSRCPVVAEGSHMVLRTFFLCLLCARSGHAYSVDNWFRCRRLRRQQSLSERDGPGGGAGSPPSPAHPQGLQAIYRRIPRWPRVLLLLNLAVIYCSTGLYKTGVVWAHGDALYYTLNLDHFYRVPMQALSSVVGLNLFRLATWIVHWWEMLFPLMLVGLITRWAAHEGLEPLRSRRLWVVRGCWLGLGVGAMAIAVLSAPLGAPPEQAYALQRSALIRGSVIMTAIAGGWWLLGTGRLRLRIDGRTHILDRVWFSTVFLGRRVWLTLGLVFHLSLFIFTNIGLFPPLMMASYLFCLTGDEPGRLLRGLVRAIARVLPFLSTRSRVVAAVQRGEPPLPAEDPTLSHHLRDGRRLPEALLYALLALAVLGVLLERWAGVAFAWTVAVIAGVCIAVTHVQGRRGALAGAGLTAPERARSEPSDPAAATGAEQGRATWAYGPAGRLLVGFLLVYHVTAAAVWQLPEKDSLSAFQVPSRAAFNAWGEATFLHIRWLMFSPNPPRFNMFLRIVLIDEVGEAWDLRTDVYAPERLPVPGLWYDPMRTANRNILGDRFEGESSRNVYQLWQARYICRVWALAHRGAMPRKVELRKVSYRVPHPKLLKQRGWYTPGRLLFEAGVEELLHVEYCAAGIHAQLPNFIRERHGLPRIDDEGFRPWIKSKRSAWERRHEAQVSPLGPGRPTIDPGSTTGEGP